MATTYRSNPTNCGNHSRPLRSNAPRNSCRRRDDSLSNISSLSSQFADMVRTSSLDSDEYVQEPSSPTGDCNDLKQQEQQPLRQRLGAEMSILASTSPEIKALNLPATPSFPLDFIQGTSSDRSCESVRFLFSPSTPVFSPPAIASSRKEDHISPLLAAMEADLQQQKLDAKGTKIDSNDPVNIFVEHKKEPENNIGEQEASVYSFQGYNLQNKYDRLMNLSAAAIDEDKENRHPNILHQTKAFRGYQDSLRKDVQYSSKSTRKEQSSILHQQGGDRPCCLNSVKKPSMHRRDSFESLPSPDEIGSLPLVLLRSPCCDCTAAAPIILNAKESRSTSRRQHHDFRNRKQQRPKSLTLITGFR